jgi:hypothetical protein
LSARSFDEPHPDPFPAAVSAATGARPPDNDDDNDKRQTTNNSDSLNRPRPHPQIRGHGKTGAVIHPRPEQARRYRARIAMTDEQIAIEQG